MVEFLVDFLAEVIGGIIELSFDPWINKAVTKWKRRRQKII